MSQVDTILIQHVNGKGGTMLINKHDFDPAKHKLPGQSAAHAAPATGSAPVAQPTPQ